MKKIFGILTVVAMFALAACGATAVTVESNALTYIADVNAGLSALAPVLSSVSGIPVATLTTISGDLTAAEAALSTIKATTATATAATTVATVEADINAGLGLLSAYPLPSGVATVVAAIKVALPFVETAISEVSTAEVGAVAPSASVQNALATLANAKAVVAQQ